VYDRQPATAIVQDRRSQIARGGEVRSWEVPGHIGSMALRKRGGAVVALASGFHFLDLASGQTQQIANPEPDKPDNRLNDGKVDRMGRFICGSMDTGEEAPTGALWRLDPNLGVERLEGGIICFNGPCWSPCGKTLYFADSFKGTIYAYDYDLDTGATTGRRVFVKVDTSRGGAPDGPRWTKKSASGVPPCSTGASSATHQTVRSTA